MRPIPHSNKVPVPISAKLPDIDEDQLRSFTSSTNSADDDDEQDIAHEAWNAGRVSLYSQSKLNDLIQDLNMPKQSAKVLASRLQKKHFLKAGTSVLFYRNREENLRKYFQCDGQLVYCTDVEGLLLAMGLSAYRSNDWRLFIDSSKKSLKCVLLYNGNQYGSIPIEHSVTLKKNYESIKVVLERLKYCVHQWLIYVDLKMVNFFLGKQGGHTKYLCLLCYWDSRANEEHWVRKEWPPRNTIKPGERHIVNNHLVDWKNIILPPLHIKLGLMNNLSKHLIVL